MADEIISALLALTVWAGVAFAILAVFPRSRNGVAYATLAILCVFTGMSALGSALVGPLDLSPMFIWGPFGLFCAVLWFHWKVKHRPSR